MASSFWWLKGRRITPLWVWKAIAPVTLGWVARKRRAALHLRLRPGVGAGPPLLRLQAPVGGEVAVEVEPLPGGLHADLHPVVVAHAALGEDAVVLPPRLRRVAPHQQAGLLGADLPGAVGVGEAHGPDPPVAVDVLHGEPAEGLLVRGVGAGAGADQAGGVGQGPLGPVRVEAGADVEGPGVQAAGDLGIAAVPLEEGVQEEQEGAGGGQLPGVDVAVHPQGGLLRVRAGGAVGHRGQPDVPPLVAGAQALQAQQVRAGLGVGPQEAGEVLVAVVGAGVEGGQVGAGRAGGLGSGVFRGGHGAQVPGVECGRGDASVRAAGRARVAQLQHEYQGGTPHGRPPLALAPLAGARRRGSGGGRRPARRLWPAGPRGAGGGGRIVRRARRAGAGRPGRPGRGAPCGWPPTRSPRSSTRT